MSGRSVCSLLGPGVRALRGIRWVVNLPILPGKSTSVVTRSTAYATVAYSQKSTSPPASGSCSMFRMFAVSSLVSMRAMMVMAGSSERRAENEGEKSSGLLIMAAQVDRCSGKTRQDVVRSLNNTSPYWHTRGPFGCTNQSLPYGRVGTGRAATEPVYYIVFKQTARL